MPYCECSAQLLLWRYNYVHPSCHLANQKIGHFHLPLELLMPDMPDMPDMPLEDELLIPDMPDIPLEDELLIPDMPDMPDIPLEDELLQPFRSLLNQSHLPMPPC